jgi:hypothetical protein
MMTLAETVAETDHNLHSTGGRPPRDCWAPIKSPAGRARARDARMSPEDQARLREELAAQAALEAIERDLRAAWEEVLYADSLTTGRRPPREGYAPIRHRRHVARTPGGARCYRRTTGGHPPAECRAPQKPKSARCL